MPANFTLPLQTVIPGQLITAALWNNEWENIDTNFTPDGMDDASVNDTAFETDVDPYPGSVNSRPTSLTGELQRLRFQIRNITGKSKWQFDPDVDIATFKTRFDAHTHSGAANQGPQLGTSALQDLAVTNAKINDVAASKITGQITNSQISDVATSKLTGTISNSQIANNAVDENKIATSVAGNGLGGGGGSPLSVNTDDSTIEKSSDALRVKDAGITESKLATAVVNKLGQTIGLTTIASLSAGQSVNFTGQGRLLGICAENNGGSASNFTLTIDGISVPCDTSLPGGQGLIWPANPGSGSGNPIQASTAGALNSLGIFFKTSLVVSKSTGSTPLRVAYERSA